MKKIAIILGVLIGLISCKNQELDFPDFEYTSGFFPYQYPVRTIILGDYIYDNTNDNNHLFLISAAIGGVYSNEKDRVFDIEIDETLCDNTFFASSMEPVKVMPSHYFDLASDQIIVQKGKFNGGVEVRLTDAFFNDPEAIKTSYVLPIRLVGSNDVDTLLAGRPLFPNADPRVANQWEVLPKNFTLFGVKFINEYHGKYFYYGNSSVKNLSGTVIENNTYQDEYTEYNPIVSVQTSGRHQVVFDIDLKSQYLTGSVKMFLDFDGDNCTITGQSTQGYTVTGRGQFKTDEFIWGNKLRNGLVIEYEITDGNLMYTGKDNLVLRDREVVMEVFEPVVQ